MSDKPLEITELHAEFWKESQPTRKQMYEREFTKYLASKLEPYNIPTHIFMEIAQYAMVGTSLVVSDEVNTEIRRVDKDYRNYISRLEKELYNYQARKGNAKNER